MLSNFSLQRAGGISGLVLAATYVVGFGLLFAVLLPRGFDPSGADAVAGATFVAANRAILHLWNLIIFVVNAVFLVVLVLAIHRRLRSGAPDGMAEVATAFGLIWAGLVLASGMIANVGMAIVAELVPRAPESAAQLQLALATVGDGLGGGNEITGGIWVALVSGIALSARATAAPGDPRDRGGRRRRTDGSAAVSGNRGSDLRAGADRLVRVYGHGASPEPAHRCRRGIKLTAASNAAGRRQPSSCTR